MGQRKHGLPIGNLTSQLFANIYLDAFDHFVKENLRRKYYIRYTDDAVILASTREELSELLPWIEVWLWQNRCLTLHPKKLEIRKLQQGIDFLGYITLPHHRIIRVKTKRRMLKKVNVQNVSSYLGVLAHCDARKLRDEIIKRVSL